MSLLDAADEVDLLERGTGRMGRVGRLEGGPELGSDHSLAQTRNVGVGALMHACQIICDHIASRAAVDAYDPRKIIVPVDERRALENGARHGERIVGRHRSVCHRAAPYAQLTGTATKRTTPSPFETNSSAGFFESVLALSIALATSPGCSTA